MIPLVFGVVGLFFKFKALSIAAISLSSITLTFTIMSKKVDFLTVLKFAFELGGLIFGIIGVL